MKKIFIFTIVLTLGLVAFLFGGKKVSAKDITVEPAETSKPSGDSYSKDYINVRNALIEIGDAGGGKLTVKPGHYYISNTLYVGSNTTINFEGKVIFEKLGGKACSSTLFQLIPFKQRDAVDVVGKYDGVKNVNFIGSTTTYFDMKNVNKGDTPAIAIVMANNSNVNIYGISFENIKNGHFIEMDGCKDVKLVVCAFQKMADNKYHNKEAVNLDTNDVRTGGFSQNWSRQDRTPNKNISFINCAFYKLVRGIGTHRYSLNKYHTNIKVDHVKTPIGMLNWKNSKVIKNQFQDSKPNKRYKYSFLMAGVRNLTFTKNVLYNLKGKTVLKYYKKYQTSHKEYKATKSKLSKKNIKALKNNRAIFGTKRVFKIGKKKYKWKN